MQKGVIQRAVPVAVTAVLTMVTTLMAKASQAQDRYIALALGTSQTSRGDLRLEGFPPGTDVTFGGTTWRNEPFTLTPYYVLKLGTYFSGAPRWGVELDFTHSKSIARTGQNVSVNGQWKGEPISTVEPLNQKVQAARFTNGVNILSVIALRRFSDRESRWQPYLGLGPSYYILWSRSTVEGEERYARYWGTGWGWIAQAGVRYRLHSGGALFAEVKYTEGPARARTAGDGTLSTTLRTFHQTFGYALTW